jgi:hypothetical protein
MNLMDLEKLLPLLAMGFALTATGCQPEAEEPTEILDGVYMDIGENFRADFTGMKKPNQNYGALIEIYVGNITLYSVGEYYPSENLDYVEGVMEIPPYMNVYPEAKEMYSGYFGEIGLSIDTFLDEPGLLGTYEWSPLPSRCNSFEKTDAMNACLEREWGCYVGRKPADFYDEDDWSLEVLEFIPALYVDELREEFCED